MNNERTVFSQILDFIPRHQFRACVNRYNGNHRTKSFSRFDQYLTMAFAQLTYRDSLRDVETCLRALEDKLYRCGFRGKISRSTLADANEKRNWQIYHDFAQALIAKARQLYTDEDFGVILKNTVYALDATVSGGPVLGVERTPDEEVTYRLFGIQSSWLSSSRILRATPIENVIKLIDKKIEEGKKERPAQ